MLEYGGVDSLRCRGTGTPHLVLDLIDYLMYRAAPQQYSNNNSLRFAYRNSVEYHFPRGNSNEKDWMNEIVDDIGDLYLLAKSDNSSLDVRSPIDKVNQLAGRVNNLPPKRREMYQLTLSEGWTPDVVRRHADSVLGIVGGVLKRGS